MEEFAQKEVAALQAMVCSWKNSYVAMAEPGEEWDFLVEDLLGEIDTHVYPYARRLYECNYLNDAEARSLLDFCYEQAEDLRKLLEQVKG